MCTDTRWYGQLEITTKGSWYGSACQPTKIWTRHKMDTFKGESWNRVSKEIVVVHIAMKEKWISQFAWMFCYFVIRIVK